MKATLFLIWLLIASVHCSDLLKNLSKFDTSKSTSTSKFAKDNSPFSESESEYDEYDEPPVVHAPPKPAKPAEDGTGLDVLSQLKNYQARLPVPKNIVPPKKHFQEDEESERDEPSQQIQNHQEQSKAIQQKQEAPKPIDNYEEQKQAQIEKYAKKFHLEDSKEMKGGREVQGENIQAFMPKINFTPLSIKQDATQVSKAPVQQSFLSESEEEEESEEVEDVKPQKKESNPSVTGLEGLSFFNKRMAKEVVSEDDDDEEVEVEKPAIQKKSNQEQKKSVAQQQYEFMQSQQKQQEVDEYSDTEEEEVEQQPQSPPQPPPQLQQSKPIKQFGQVEQQVRQIQKARVVSESEEESEVEVEVIKKPTKKQKRVQVDEPHKQSQEQQEVVITKKHESKKEQLQNELQQQLGQNNNFVQMVKPQQEIKETKETKENNENHHHEHHSQHMSAPVVPVVAPPQPQQVMRVQTIKKPIQQELLQEEEYESEYDDNDDDVNDTTGGAVQIQCDQTINKQIQQICKLCQQSVAYKISIQNWQKVMFSDEYRQSFEPLMEFVFKSIGETGDYYLTFKDQFVCVTAENLQKTINLDKVLKHFTGNSLSDYHSPLNIPAKNTPWSFLLHAEHDSLLNGFACRRFSITVKSDLMLTLGKQSSMSVRAINFQKNKLRVKYSGTIAINGVSHQASMEQTEGGGVTDLVVSQLNLPKESAIVENLSSNYLVGDFVKEIMLQSKQQMVADLSIGSYRHENDVGLSFNLKRHRMN